MATTFLPDASSTSKELAAELVQGTAVGRGPVPVAAWVGGGLLAVALLVGAGVWLGGRVPAPTAGEERASGTGPGEGASAPETPGVGGVASRVDAGGPPRVAPAEGPVAAAAGDAAEAADAGAGGHDIGVAPGAGRPVVRKQAGKKRRKGRRSRRSRKARREAPKEAPKEPGLRIPDI